MFDLITTADTPTIKLVAHNLHWDHAIIEADKKVAHIHGGGLPGQHTAPVMLRSLCHELRSGGYWAVIKDV